MSDLIEKVHGAVSNYCTHSGPPIQGRPCGICDAITRVAIAAVAEWLNENYRSCPCTLSCASILKLEQPK